MCVSYLFLHFGQVYTLQYLLSVLFWWCGNTAWTQYNKKGGEKSTRRDGMDG